jgi:hypothetical protein
MRRREFITLLGGVAAWPLAARGQQKIPTVGFLGVLTPEPLAAQLAAFTAALNASVSSPSVHIEYRWAEGEYDRLPDLAADLIAYPWQYCLRPVETLAPSQLQLPVTRHPLFSYRAATPCSSAWLAASPGPAVTRLA